MKLSYSITRSKMGLSFLARSQPRPGGECRSFGRRSVRKPNEEPMRGKVGHPVRSPPRRVNNLASVVRVITTFRSPICYCQDGCGTRPPPGGSFLAVLGTRQPAVCRRQSASVCGMFLAPQRKRRYRLKRVLSPSHVGMGSR
jgi:hypothetical protein